MPDGTIYELSVDMDLNGNKVINVHHFEQTSADFGEDPRQELINAYQADVEGPQLLCQSDDILIEGYRVRAIHPVETQSFSLAAPAAGTLVGEALPANAGALLTWYTEEGSPIRIGRSFLPGIREQDTVRGVVISTLRTVLVGLGNALVAEIESGNALTFEKVLWRAADETFLRVITGEIRQRIKGLRSRTRGVGQ